MAQDVSFYLCNIIFLLSSLGAGFNPRKSKAPLPTLCSLTSSPSTDAIISTTCLHCSHMDIHAQVMSCMYSFACLYMVMHHTHIFFILLSLLCLCRQHRRQECANCGGEIGRTQNCGCGLRQWRCSYTLP